MNKEQATKEFTERYWSVEYEHSILVLDGLPPIY